MTDEEKVMRFMAYARCSRYAAIDYLTQWQWDYDIAIAMYWRDNIAIY